MDRQMLRYELNKIKQMGLLMEVNNEVDPKFELGSILKKYKNRRPIIFNKVKGYRMPVCGALYTDREVLYKLIGIRHEERIFKLMEAIANPKPVKLLNYGPVMENIITGNVNVRTLPNPYFHEKDSSTYITAGMLVVKDIKTGKRYTSIRRFQVIDKNKISALIASPYLTNQFLEMEKQNKPLEVAIVLGYDVPFLLASQVSSELYGVDKYEIDSAIRGEALEVVKCKTVDLEVPAHSEIVLEGIMVPNRREKEGPFGELMGYYGQQGIHPIIEIKAIMHRNNPIYQTAFPCREEHLANGLLREVELYYSLKRLVDVKDVHVTLAGGYRFHAVASIKKKQEGDGKTAIIGALSSIKDLKHVVIVDDDIDIFDMEDVELAIATRFQASKDLVVIQDACGTTLDPSHTLRGVTDKLGLDATKPLNNERFERCKIPKV
ncbi:UbiD family decarboxylase [Caloramator australicus]|uniref:3-polyprenyl-4-hydroxybenzoate carboxy-lyase n=1 Tax=Caloramator australicus RC3 TaxID=857293 RepID=I7J4Y4_9CLOT|nr:UbiD family decarboxylase [Caloramator australicus]CCJ33241.1 3-polyprenyl-4-hydroxybenzoate carboxy-lyase [Caloramator australicus RC3]